MNKNLKDLISLRITFLTLLLFSVALSMAQIPELSEENVDRRPVNEKEKTTFKKKKEYLLEFKNINVVPYYYDKGELKKIVRYEKKKKFEKALPVMRDYVKSFGIQNFYKDTYLIWRLSALCDKLGKREEAMAWVQLVLKHHRGDITPIKNYYDSISLEKKDYYVPLDFYYKLVDARKNVDTMAAPRSALTNMGANINSKSDDYGPAISLEKNEFVFTSKRVKSGLDFLADEDLFIAEYSDGGWDEAKPLSSINTTFNEGSACLSKDGMTIYFSRCASPDGYGNCDIYMAKRREDGVWKDVKNLGANINSAAWDSHPSLSHSGDTLFFASDRIGGFGLSDIYFSVKDKKGVWQPAKNMGPVINTRNSEVSPYYHPKYEVLYFSSTGHLVNFGDFDIYKSYNVKGNWTEPKNIGPLVNGSGSEYYFTIDAESRNLYYAKTRDKEPKVMDLFSFPLPMEAQPDAVTTVFGVVTDSLTGNPFIGVVSIIDLDEKVEVAPKFTRPDGSFEFDLIDNRNYLLIVQRDEDFRVERMFYLDGDTRLDIEAPTIQHRRWEFVSIEFEPNQSEILEDMILDLMSVVKFLGDHPDLNLRITGHTDQSGNPERNQKLSQDRANAIKDFIIASGGFPSNRVEAIGYGSSLPIYEIELTEEHKRVNRRVEFELLRVDDSIPILVEPTDDW